jgi:hypothetical protein
MTITLDEALAKIVSSGEIPQRIAFVRSQGKEAGTIKDIVAYYGAPNPKDPTAAPGKQKNKETDARKQRTSHLESGTIPLTEFGSRRMQTPFIFNLLALNGAKIVS